VVLDDLDVVGIASNPSEADSELIVDPNAVLSKSVTYEFLQASRWRGLLFA
jgi:hypothetical protein